MPIFDKILELPMKNKTRPSDMNGEGHHSVTDNVTCYILCYLGSLKVGQCMRCTPILP
jgi:hypothetical protein